MSNKQLGKKEGDGWKEKKTGENLSGKLRLAVLHATQMDHGSYQSL